MLSTELTTPAGNSVSYEVIEAELAGRIAVGGLVSILVVRRCGRWAAARRAPASACSPRWSVEVNVVCRASSPPSTCSPPGERNLQEEHHRERVLRLRGVPPLRPRRQPAEAGSNEPELETGRMDA